MIQNERIMSLLGGESRILAQDKDSLTLKIDQEGGSLVSVFHVFPGMDLISYEPALPCCQAVPASDSSSARPSLPPGQMHLARKIRAYLDAHMDRRTTIEELSEIFHVSPSQVKNCMKNVYGMSVYAFARSRKMRAAAQLLRHSDATVLEIGGRFGYDNGSKFAKAFRAVIGMNPEEYRKSGSCD